MRAFFVTLPIALIPAVLFTILGNFFVLFALVFPFAFLLLAYVQFAFVRYNTKVFLSGSKQVHNFEIEDAKLLRNKTQIKVLENIKIFRYKKFLFMVTAKTYYVIKNEDYLEGCREEFISWAKGNSIRVGRKFW